MKPKNKPSKEKNPYVKPDLSVHGDLKKITTDAGSQGTDFDWGSH